jgi:hypothetical protein
MSVHNIFTTPLICTTHLLHKQQARVTPNMYHGGNVQAQVNELVPFNQYHAVEHTTSNGSNSCTSVLREIAGLLVSIPHCYRLQTYFAPVQLTTVYLPVMCVCDMLDNRTT